MRMKQMSLEEGALIPVFLNALHLPSLWISSQIFPSSEPPFLVIYIAVPICTILIPTTVGTISNLYRMCFRSRLSLPASDEVKRANYELTVNDRDTSNQINLLESPEYERVGSEKVSPLQLQSIGSRNTADPIAFLFLAFFFFFVSYSMVAFQNLMHIRCVHFGTISQSPTEILDRTYKTMIFTGIPAVLYICLIAKYKLSMLRHLYMFSFAALVATVVISMPESFLQWMPLFPFSLSFVSFQVIPSLILFQFQTEQLDNRRLTNGQYIKLLFARHIGFELALLTPYLMRVLGGFTPFLLIMSTITFFALQFGALKRTP